MATERFDVLVIGAGSGGVACASALAQGGANVAIVERERVGGECAYWACVPSKVLLRSADPNAQSADVPGSREARSGPPVFAAAAAWRTSMVSDYNDTEHATFVRESGVTLVRGDAAILGPRRVRVGERELEADNLVIATGSEHETPPIPGLADGPFWTSRDATAAASVPERLIFLGGGAVSVELAQVFARYGSRVTIVESAPQLLPKEEPAVAQLARELLERDGTIVRTGVSAKHVAWREGLVSVEIAGDDPIEGTQLCVATGRAMRTRGFGLELSGATIDEHGHLTVDEQCRVADGVYAIGDVSGKALFTHVAKYQARIVAAAILGATVRANYDTVPRCVYTAPEIAATGLTRREAEERGLHVVSGHVDFHEITRPALTCEDEAMGAIELLADARTGLLVGGWIVAPSASEMIAFVSTAIRAKTPIPVLLDVVQPYPTFSEGFYVALDRIARAL